ncbi:MAG: hypothetical protein PHZ09_06865, partial [Eubacteriales bacterium]|nr:hypothetical protein [Eubacteriales bacterium]
PFLVIDFCFHLYFIIKTEKSQIYFKLKNRIFKWFFEFHNQQIKYYTKEKKTMSIPKCVAYLDILGFSSYILKDTSGALNLLDTANQEIKTRLIDPASSTYNEPSLQKMVKIHSAESFEAYLPMSDSIFIIGQNPNDFVEQVSSFLCSCYCSTSHVYSHPENESNPITVTMNQFKIDTDGGFTTSDVIANWYPNIFRGGVSIGEAAIFSTLAIFRNQELIPERERKSIELLGEKVGTGFVSNVAGKAVVEAVGLEKNGGTGPKLFLTSEIINALDDEHKTFVKTDYDGKKHFLWPVYFIDSFDNDLLIEWNSTFNDIVKGSINLYKYHVVNSNSHVADHYKEFVKLIADSFIAVSTFKKYTMGKKLLKEFFEQMGFPPKSYITEFNIEL